jgi:hypothetical protein
MKASRIVLAFSIAALLSSCILNTLDTSHRLDVRNGTFLDTQKNRISLNSTYERSIQREYKGEPHPPAYANWDAMWDRTFKTLKNGTTENPEFYVNYIQQRRKELGLLRN